MAENVKLMDFMGWVISVTAEGRFVADKDGRHNHAESKDLASLKKNIAARVNGRVELMNFRPPVTGREYWDSIPSSTPPKVTVVGRYGEKWRLEDGRTVFIDHPIRYDPDIVASVQEFINRRQRLLEELDTEYKDWAAAVSAPVLSAVELENLLAEHD